MRNNRKALWLLLPAVFLYSLFVVYPYADSFLYSFTDWIGVGPKHFIGLQNYIRLFTSPQLAHPFWRALSHNAILFGVSMLFTVGLGLTFAFILSSRKLRGREFFKWVYFLPYIMPGISTGFVWLYIFNPRWGPLNEILKYVGLGNYTHAWLGEPGLAFPTMIAVYGLKLTGLYILFFLAALLSIPSEYRDAAMVDGCTRLQEVWYIEIPLLKPTILLLTLLNFINAFNVFDLIFVLGGVTGAPFGQSDVISLLFYRTAFGTPTQPPQYGLGMAATLAVVLLLMFVMVGLAFQRLIKRSHVEY